MTDQMLGADMDCIPKNLHQTGERLEQVLHPQRAHYGPSIAITVALFSLYVN